MLLFALLPQKLVTELIPHKLLISYFPNCAREEEEPFLDQSLSLSSLKQQPTEVVRRLSCSQTADRVQARVTTNITCKVIDPDPDEDKNLKCSAHF